MEKPQETRLPRLRQDLQLNPAPAEDGAPTWTLYDPGANKYYKIGWLEFECLSRFRRCDTAAALMALVKRETTLEPEEGDIVSLVNFLFSHGLVQSDNAAFVEYLSQQKSKRHKAFWEKAMHGYLFFMVPLFKPQKFLKAVFPYVSFLFTRKFFMGVLLLLGYGFYLSLQRLDELGHTFLSYFNMEGAFYLLLTTILVKFVHEMGHAFMATKYGIPVTSLGIAVIVLYPVLYAETSQSWKMQNRQQRINISMAGVMAEITLAAVALLLWHMLPPGMGQSLCFMVAVVSLAASLAVNTNPLMRFDGYFLMSDLVGIDNLQDRAFAFAKWKLRSWLFGWDDGPPDQMPAERRNFLVIFGFATMIYRFFLFMGIAFLVYFLFFKPLGLILFLVEIFYFILMPIIRELRVWLSNAKTIAASTRGKVLLALLVVGIGLSFMPAQNRVEVPAVLHAGSYTRLYPPAPAQVVEIATSSGSRVKEGQVLFRLTSPALEHSIEKANLKLKSMLTIRDREQATPELVRRRPTLEAEIETARKEVEGLEEQKRKLTVTAPFDGIARDIDPYMSEGAWIGATQMLAIIMGPESLTLSGYVSEQDVPRIHAKADGWFYAEFSPFVRFPVQLKKIEDTDSLELFWPELSTLFGGALPSERTADGSSIRPLPGHPLYAAQFSLREGEENAALPAFTARGTVVLEAEPVSMLSLLGQRFVALVMRESGF